MAEYTDVKGNIHEVTSTVPLSEKEKSRIEDEIVEQLCEIFMRK